MLEIDICITVIGQALEIFHFNEDILRISISLNVSIKSGEQ